MASMIGLARSFNGSTGGIHGGHSIMSKKKASKRRWLHYRSSSSSSSQATTTRSQLMDQYKTLQLQPGASESDVKKSFRRLALQYHPDVCKGSNCGVQFHKINEAYDIVMSNLRGESTTTDLYDTYNDVPEDEPMRGMHDPDWELWEEWMGWEGAGIRDYSSHINPYI